MLILSIEKPRNDMLDELFGVIDPCDYNNILRLIQTDAHTH